MSNEDVYDVQYPWHVPTLFYKYRVMILLQLSKLPLFPCTRPHFHCIMQMFCATTPTCCLQTFDGPLVPLDITLLDHGDSFVHPTCDGTEAAGVRRGGQIRGIVFQADSKNRSQRVFPAREETAYRLTGHKMAAVPVPKTSRSLPARAVSMIS